jgi:hypothetical protein
VALTRVARRFLLTEGIFSAEATAHALTRGVTVEPLSRFARKSLLPEGVLSGEGLSTEWFALAGGTLTVGVALGEES